MNAILEPIKPEQADETAFRRMTEEEQLAEAIRRSDEATDKSLAEKRNARRGKFAV